jgi:uncharacterized phiE125 gp8 family phage protein
MQEALKLKIITPPPVEPVTLEEVKAQLRIDEDDTSLDDALTPIITAAREWCEGYQNRAYVEQTLEFAQNGWPCDRFIIPRPPLQSVSSVKYTNSDNVETTWSTSSYVMDNYSEPGQLLKKNGVCWPSECFISSNGIKVRYVAGYEAIPGEVVEGEVLGTASGTASATFTASFVPIVSSSESVFFNGVTSSSYTINYETGAVICNPGNGVVVTIDYTQETDYRSNIPQRIRQAIILLILHWFENGMCEPPCAVKSLLSLDRVVIV